MSAFAFAVILIIQGLVVPGQNGIVTGQVRTRDGTPAAGVRVVAQAAEAGATSTDGAAFASLAETDAQGRYRLEGVPPGRYYIAAGLVSALSYYPGVATISEATSVLVTSGSALSSVNFALARSAGVRVSGAVRGLPENSPNNLRRVALSPISIPGVRITDVALQPDGRFEFTRVAPGSYNVMTSATSTATIRIEVGDRDIADIELKLPPVLMGRVVVEGGDRLPVQFPLQQAALAAGVTDPSALVRLQVRRASVTTTTAIPTAGGVFALVLPPGEYQIVFSLLPLGYYVKSFTHTNVNLLEKPLVVTENSKSEIQLTLTKTPPPGAQPGVTVSGRVNNIPADGVFIPLSVSIQSATNVAASEQRMSEVLVQADGRFALQDVPPGNYTIRPSSGTPQTISVTTAGLSGVELQYTAPRTIVLPVLTPLPPPPPPTPTIQISGKVVVIPGTAMPQGIRLRSFRLQQSPLGGEQSRINPDGTFQFQGALPGEFDLNLVDTLLPTSRNFTAMGNQDITGIEVKVPIAARGRVVLGEPGGQFPILSIRNVYDPGQSGGARSSPTVQRATNVQPNGSFTVEVVFGEQNISVANVPAGFSVKSITYGTMDLMKGPLRVTGPLTSEILVTLEKK